MRVLEGLVRLLIGGQATTPNVQFDIWVFGSGGTEPRTEPTVWGNWWGYGEGSVAGYLPSIEGFLLLFLYSYFWLNILHQHSDPQDNISRTLFPLYYGI